MTLIAQHNYNNDKCLYFSSEGISVKTGEQLKLDVLFPNVNEVKLQTESSSEDKEIWKRGHDVHNDRVTVRGSNLNINDFTASDAGTYLFIKISHLKYDPSPGV